MKLCLVLNRQGQVVAWVSQTAKTAGQAFLPLVTALEGQSSGLADRGFQAAQADPANLKLCRRGKWNERRLIETAFPQFTNEVQHLVKVQGRRVAAAGF